MRRSSKAFAHDTPTGLGIAGVGERGWHMDEESTILVAAPLDDITAQVSGTLRAAGYHVETAVDSQEAMERAHRSRFDLIVCDIGMPAMSGLGFVESLKRDVATSHIPIVIISAQVVPPEDQQLRTLETGRHLSKFSSMEELLAAVRSALLGPGRLLHAMKQLDPDTSPVTGDEQCKWVRSRFGILGIVRIEDLPGGGRLKHLLDERIAHAHALLDALGEELLSFEDLWNLTLLISVPWGEDEIDRSPELLRALLACAKNTSGSRKVVLWRGTSLAQHFGPLGGAEVGGTPVEIEPLREAVNSVARDDVEREALQALFKRRISEEELDKLIQALGRQGEQ